MCLEYDLVQKEASKLLLVAPDNKFGLTWPNRISNMCMVSVGPNGGKKLHKFHHTNLNKYVLFYNLLPGQDIDNNNMHVL
jgi:hypothetical protein